MDVDREVFLRNLETVTPGLSPREIVEQSSCFVFKDGEVITYNDEVSCRGPSGLDASIEGAVPAAKFLELLHKLREETIGIDNGKTGEGGTPELRVRGFSSRGVASGRRAGVRLEHSIALPYDAVEEPRKWSPLPGKFLDAIKIVQECAGQDESLFALTCIHLHPNHLESCDNCQLVRYSISVPISKSTLVRKEALKHIVPLGVTEMAETKSWLHFRVPDANAKTEVRIACRRYVEEYPDLTKLLSITAGSETKLPKGIAEAAEVAEIFSSDSPDDNQIEVTLLSGKVRVHGRGVSGWYKETRDVDYLGPDLRFFISPKLLIEVVSKATKCQITADRLVVEKSKWVYVTALTPPPPPTAAAPAKAKKVKAKAPAGEE